MSSSPVACHTSHAPYLICKDARARIRKDSVLVPSHSSSDKQAPQSYTRCITDLIHVMS